MRKSTKVISMLLAILMAFSCFSGLTLFSASATDQTDNLETTSNESKIVASSDSTEQTTSEDVYVVAGCEELTGYFWVSDPDLAPENVMTKLEDIYTITYEDVQPEDVLSFMIVKSSSDGEETWIGDAYDNELKFSVETACDVTIEYDPATGKVDYYGEGVSTAAIDAVYVVGNGQGNWLNGISWGGTQDAENQMTEIDENVYEFFMEDVEASDSYEFQFMANGTWESCWGYYNGEVTDFDQATEAVYGGDVIKLPFESYDTNTYDITISLDLSSFDPISHTGAYFTVSAVDSEEEIYYTTVYCKLNNGWENLNVFYYEKAYDPETSEYKDIVDPTLEWPGVPMKKLGGDIYYAEVPTTYSNILCVKFNNGSEETMELEHYGEYNVYNLALRQWDYWEPVRRVTFYVDLNNGWENVNACYSGGIGDDVSFPGVEMTHVEGTVYSLTVLEDITSISFNNGTDSTEEVPFHAGNCIYDMTDATWYVYYPDGYEDDFSKFVVAGSESLTGYNWVADPEFAPECVMTYLNKVEDSYYASGHKELYTRQQYVKTFKNVQPGVRYQFKVVQTNYYDDGSSAQYWYGDENSSNIEFYVEKACDVTIRFDYYDEVITVTGDGVKTVSGIEVDSMYVVGNGEDEWLNGIAWQPNAEENKMTEISDNVYQFVMKGVEAFDDYQLKFVANGTWNDNWGASEVIEFGKPSDAVYDAQQNIHLPFDADDTNTYTITCVIDLNSFDYATKTGATFKINAVAEGSSEPATPDEPVTPDEPATPDEPTTEDTTEDTTETPKDIYVVAGSEGLTGLVWNGNPETAVDNIMTVNSDGIYSITFEQVPSAENLQFKIVKNNTEWIGDATGNNYTFNVVSTCDVTITYNPANGEVTFTGEGVKEITTLEIDAMYAVGNGDDAWLNGVAWQPNAEVNKMEEISDNVYQFVMEGVEAFDNYQIKFAANGTWADSWGAPGTIVFGEAFEAVYNGQNILLPFAGDDTNTYTITCTIDLNGFDYSTKTGGTITISVEEEGTPVTVKAAAPVAKNAYSNWNGVDLYYGNTAEFEEMTKLTMSNTGKTTIINDVATCASLVTGEWAIYELVIDEKTAEAIQEAKYVGFSKTGATNRTHLNMNVLYALVNEYTGVYTENAKTLAELEGTVFVIQDTISQTNKTSISAFAGEWQTEDVYTASNPETVTINFAAPRSSKAVYDWSKGVELYYGTADNYNNTSRIAMTKTDATVAVDVSGTNLETLTSCDWTVYSVTLNADQIEAIENSENIGFIKQGSFNRTSFMVYRNILRAGKAGSNESYSYKQNSIFDYDGCTFIIDGHYPTSAEGISYTGSWVK